MLPSLLLAPALALVVPLALPLVAMQPGQARQSASVAEILDGDQLYIDRRQVRVKARAISPEVVSTGDSRAQLIFSSGAAGRLNRFSMLRLASSCFLLDQGQILVSGPQNACTRSARLSVRGTNYLVAVQDDGSAQLTVLEGQVEVEPLNNGQPSGQGATMVTAGQQLTISAAGVLEAVLQLSPADYRSILAGPLFEGFRSAMPGFAALERYLQTSLPDLPLPSLPETPAVPNPSELLQIPNLNPF